jgi:hypothetical protein
MTVLKTLVNGGSGLDFRETINAAVDTSNIVAKGRKTVKPVKPDGMLSVEQGTGAITSNTGYAWVRLPDLEGTQYIRNQLPGGIPVAFQFRRRMRVNMPGVRSMGDWNPDAAATGVQSLNNIGTLSNTTDYGYRLYSSVGLPATAGVNNGDYLDVYPIGGGTITNAGTGLGTLYPGDLVVRWNNAWVVQRAPAGTAATADRDWWNVSAAGVFAGVTYAIGDRIVLLGDNLYRGYSRVRNELGEMVNRGELDASTGTAPTNPVKGDAWQISVAGTISGVVLAVNDWLLHDGSTFYGVATNLISTTVVNKPFMIDITGDLSDWEVRRADKSTSTYQVRLMAPGQQGVNSNSDAVDIFGDSMTHNAIAQFVAAFGAITINPRGLDSSGSSSIASRVEFFARTGTLAYGRATFIWAGQNTENDWQVTIGALTRIRRLLAPFDTLMIPLTPVGRREFTFAGGRLVGKWHEPMKIGTDTTNGMMMTVRETARLTNGRYINTRQVVIDAVAANPGLFSGPDKQAPGMTESQTAATYGWVPLSCYRTNATITAATNFIGYWTDTAALPTGGAAGDYYIRSAATGSQYVGNLIVNVSGTWTEDGTADRNNTVHFQGAPNSNFANTAVANAVKARYDDPSIVSPPVPGL